jgi:hypothetical protein
MSRKMPRYRENKVEFQENNLTLLDRLQQHTEAQQIKVIARSISHCLTRTPETLPHKRENYLDKTRPPRM